MLRSLENEWIICIPENLSNLNSDDVAYSKILVEFWQLQMTSKKQNFFVCIKTGLYVVNYKSLELLYQVLVAKAVWHCCRHYLMISYIQLCWSNFFLSSLMYLFILQIKSDAQLIVPKETIFVKFFHATPILWAWDWSISFPMECLKLKISPYSVECF